MNKNILKTALALSAALTLSACSNTPNTTTKTNDTATNNTAVETTNSTTNTTNTKTNKTTNNATANSTNSQTETNATSGELAKATVTNDQAYDKFLELHPGTKIDSFSLGLDDGVLKYSIDGYDDTNEYEVNINAVDGTVISDELDKDDDRNQGDIKKEDIAKANTFIEEALKDAGADYIAKGYGFNYDDGKFIVEVEVHNGSKDIDYDYDFETGKLIEKDM